MSGISYRLISVAVTFLILSSYAGGDVNRWTNDGPYGGYITCLAISDLNPDVMVVGTLTGGVFRTTNGGLNWQAAAIPPDDGSPLQILFTLSVHFVINTQDRVLLGTTRGIFRSTDGGISWANSSQGLPVDCRVNSFAQLESEGGDIIAGTGGHGLFRSKDGGQSWEQLINEISSTNIYRLNTDPTDPAKARLFAATDQGLFRSNDAGLSWQRRLFSLTSCVGLHVSAVGVVYASNDRDLYRSRDSGDNWEIVPGLWCPGITSILTDPFTFGTIYAGSSACGINKSTDDGENWTELFDPTLDTKLTLLSFSKDGKTLFAGTQSGLNRSEDGGTTWHPSFDGGTKTSVRSLLYVPDRGCLYAGTSGGVFLKKYPGAPWEVTRAGISINSLAVGGGFPSILFAGTETMGVLKSTDGGYNWVQVTTSLPQRCLSVFIPSIKSNTIYAAIFGYGVIKSVDAGMTWSLISNGLSDPRIFTLKGDSNQMSTLYVGCWDGLFRSSDDGEHWSMILNVPNGLVKAFLADIVHPGVLFAGTSYNLWKSTDNGTTWKVSSYGMTAPSIFSLYLKSETGELYAGSAGLYRSIDGGENWAQYDPGFFGPALCFLEDPFYANTLLAGSFGAWSFKPSLDVNADNVVNSADSDCLSDFLSESLSLVPAGTWAADVNLDGHIDILDLLVLKRATLK